MLQVLIEALKPLIDGGKWWTATENATRLEQCGNARYAPDHLGQTARIAAALAGYKHGQVKGSCCGECNTLVGQPAAEPIGRAQQDAAGATCVLLLRELHRQVGQVRPHRA